MSLVCDTLNRNETHSVYQSCWIWGGVKAELGMEYMNTVRINRTS